MLSAWAALAQPMPAPEPPVKSTQERVPVLPGVWVDWEHGVLEATASSSADLYAASAEVARIKAERLCRLRAEERLRKALLALSRDEKQRARLEPYGGADQVARLDPARARILNVDYAASGSVSLRIGLSLLAEKKGNDEPPQKGAADGGIDLGAGK